MQPTPEQLAQVRETEAKMKELMPEFHDFFAGLYEQGMVEGKRALLDARVRRLDEISPEEAAAEKGSLVSMSDMMPSGPWHSATWDKKENDR